MDVAVTVIAYVQSLIDAAIAASPALSMLVASVGGTVLAAIVAVRVRLFVRRVNARREAVLALLRQIDAEHARIAHLGPISHRMESGGNDSGVHIQALVGAYQDMCRRLTRRQVGRLEATWERYQSQISDPDDEQQIAGYRNFLSANSELLALAKKAEPYAR